MFCCFAKRPSSLEPLLETVEPAAMGVPHTVNYCCVFYRLERLSRRSECCPVVGGRLRSRFVDDIEGRLSGTAETAEAGLSYDLADALFPRLGPQTHRNFLRARTRGAQQRGKRIINTPHGVEVVLQFIVRVRFDNHPGAVF